MSPHIVDFSVLVVDISFGRCEYSSGFLVGFRFDLSTLGLSEPARVKRPHNNPQGNSQGPWRPTCAGWIAPPPSPPRAFIIHRNSVRELGCLAFDCSSALRCGRMQVGRNAWPRLNGGCPPVAGGAGALSHNCYFALKIQKENIGLCFAENPHGSSAGA